MRYFYLIILFASFQLSYAQLDSRTGAFPKKEEKSSPTEFPSSNLGLRSSSSTAFPDRSLLFSGQTTNSERFQGLGLKKEKQTDITAGDGLVEYKTDWKPRSAVVAKEDKMPKGANQALGEIVTDAHKLHVLYRDHQVVDGDYIRVLVNDEIVIYETMLEAHFKGLHLPLKVGVNKVDFLALNQGDSGPNTAELHVYDDDGKLVSKNEWNLLTGYKATVVIVKQADPDADTPSIEFENDNTEEEEL